MKREPPSRGEKILAMTSAGLIFAILAGMIWLQKINEEPAIVFPPVKPLPSPNAYDLHLRAAQSMRGWNGPYPSSGATETLADAILLKRRNGMAPRETWLEANATGFNLVQKALLLPCRYPSERGGAPLPTRKNLMERRLCHRMRAMNISRFTSGIPIIMRCGLRRRVRRPFSGCCHCSWHYVRMSWTKGGRRTRCEIWLRSICRRFPRYLRRRRSAALRPSWEKLCAVERRSRQAG